MMRHKKETPSDFLSFIIVQPLTKLFFVDPCNATRCPYYSRCYSNPNSELGYKCVYPSRCSKISSQVCGSDGKTYDNECVMQQTACNDRKRVVIVKTGACGKILRFVHVTKPGEWKTFAKKQV